MKDHPSFGICVPERGWVPAPRYLLRRHQVLRVLRSLPRGEILEIGCGAGALSRDLAKQGFAVTGFDTSPAARELAEYVNRDNPNVYVCGEEQKDWGSRFDILIALEVLEHIVDDHAALERWRTWLKPKGHLLLSVPSRQDRWNASDTWAGHIRRYDRTALQDVLRCTGLSIETFESYGFPLANIIDPLRARHHARLLKTEAADASPAQNTARSGVERSLEMRLFFLQASWPGMKLMQFFCALQRLFSNTDLGNGYIVLAQRQ